MRTVIFSEAIRIQEYLSTYGTTHNHIHFEFKFPNEETILAKLFIEKNKTLISCTCKAGSVNFEALCSHKLSIIFWMFKQQMRRLKQRW